MPFSMQVAGRFCSTSVTAHPTLSALVQGRKLVDSVLACHRTETGFNKVWLRCTEQGAVRLQISLTVRVMCSNGRSHRTAILYHASRRKQKCWEKQSLPTGPGGGQLHDALSNCPPPKSKKVRKTRTHARTKLGRRSTTCFPRSPPSCSATGRQRLAQPRTTGATLNSPSARYHCRSRGHPLVAAVKTQSRQIQEVKSYKNAPNKNFQATGICRISQDGNPALVSRVRLFSRKRKEEQPRKAMMPNTVLPS